LPGWFGTPICLERPEFWTLAPKNQKKKKEKKKKKSHGALNREKVRRPGCPAASRTCRTEFLLLSVLYQFLKIAALVVQPEWNRWEYCETYQIVEKWSIWIVPGWNQFRQNCWNFFLIVWCEMWWGIVELFFFLFFFFWSAIEGNNSPTQTLQIFIQFPLNGRRKIRGTFQIILEDVKQISYVLMTGLKR
jgi:hypothetical protein